MALTTLTNGMVGDGPQITNNFLATSKLLLLYTGTGYNSTTGTSNTYTTASILPASFGSADYLILEISGTAVATHDAGASNYGRVTLKIEESYVSGGYSTLIDQTLFESLAPGASPSGYAYNTNLSTFRYVYTLTANDKANGVIFKFTTTSAGSGGTASFTNLQTTILTGV